MFNIFRKRYFSNIEQEVKDSREIQEDAIERFAVDKLHLVEEKLDLLFDHLNLEVQITEKNEKFIVPKVNK